MGWRRTTNGIDINWDNSIDGALTISIAPFTTGWRLPNIGEVFSICNFGLSTALLDYAPFSLNGAFNFWTSTTHALNTTRALLIQNTQLRITDLTKTTSAPFRYIPCRTFTVTGTTLS